MFAEEARMEPQSNSLFGVLLKSRRFYGILNKEKNSFEKEKRNDYDPCFKVIGKTGIYLYSGKS